MQIINMQNVDNSWREIVEGSLLKVDFNYLHRICTETQCLPKPHNILNAFSLPLKKTRFILFGESPYPREQSANGYAFWDAAVNQLWSNTGLAKTVNRATSLRNIMKMLLIAEGLLRKDDTSQAAIAAISKQHLIHTIDELFGNLLEQGFLLLNTSLVLTEEQVRTDAKMWRPFIQHLLESLHRINSDIQLVLMGKVAEDINKFPIANQFAQIICEHPYNVSFVHNDDVINFFKPLHLLVKRP